MPAADPGRASRGAAHGASLRALPTAAVGQAVAVRPGKRGLRTSSPRRSPRAIAVDLGGSQHRVSIEGRRLVLRTPAMTDNAWIAPTAPDATVTVARNVEEILREALPEFMRRRRAGFPLALAIPAALDT